LSRRRRWALAAIVVLCVGGGVVYLVTLSPGRVDTDARPVASGGTALAGSQLMVRAVDPDDPRLNGRVFVVKNGEPQQLAGRELSCERVYFAAGRGLCLATAETGIDYEATVFDSSLRSLHRFPLAGLPSRTRVSPDGRYGAITVFVNGHAYLGAGGFSTATTIVDMGSGKQVANLEQFDVTKDGQRFDSVDFNFWGVTFAKDPNRFYATLRTNGRYYLVEGNLRQRTMKVLRDRVECPSLSPDGRRIAYKSRIGNENRWRLKVLDLASLRAHPVAERRPIDDQVEWLNDDTLVYSDGIDLYTVSADGGGEPRLVLHDASSPVALD
jgi:WD40-like Beta Propeller Repeat